MNKVLAIVVAVTLSALSAPAFGETLEQFYQRMNVEITAEMLHPEGRFMLVEGNEAIVLLTEGLLQAQKEQKAAGVKSEVLELQILNTFEVGDFVSVATRTRTREVTGDKTEIVESSGQDLLLKKGDTFVIVFGLGRTTAK